MDLPKSVSNQVEMKILPGSQASLSQEFSCLEAACSSQKALRNQYNEKLEERSAETQGGADLVVVAAPNAAPWV